jgi:hypothetical protein
VDARAARKIGQLLVVAQEDPATPTEEKQDLPQDFAVRLGVSAILNFLTVVRYAAQGAIAARVKRDMINTDLTVYKLQDPALRDAINLGGQNIDTVRVGAFEGMFNTLADSGEFDEAQVETAREQSRLFMPEPAEGTGGGSAPWDKLWDDIGTNFATKMQQIQQSLQRTRIPGLPAAPVTGWSLKKKQVIAQVAMPAAPPAIPDTLSPAWETDPNAPKEMSAIPDTLPPEWETDPNAPKEMPSSSPLAIDRYRSVNQLRKDLIDFGPNPVIFERLMGYVGPKNEDSAKEALSQFFRGSPTALFVLYDMLVQSGIASPIDVEVVEEVMAKHPEIAQGDNGQPEQKPKQEFAGLYMPPSDSSLFTKVASGYLGGPNSAYHTHGPGENRMCPKIRNVVNTYICRYHCLDGLAIDDHQVICGEALWRQNVMDKYSREYRDADGNWVGGYLNKRFEIHRDTGGHPYQLKPGQRHAPIHEDAWSVEKRLQEMRRSESKAREYSETPGDPKDLYNFDQHDIAKGPETPNLSEKPMDKIASKWGIIKTAAGETMFDAPEKPGQQDPREFHDEQEMPQEDDVTTTDGQHWYQHGKLYFAGDSSGLMAKMNADQFWPDVWNVSDHGNAHLITDSIYQEAEQAGVRRASKKSLNDEWYEEDRGIHTVPDDDPKKTKEVVERMRLKRERDNAEKKTEEKTASNPGDPLMENVNVGQVGTQCPKCAKKFDQAATICDACGMKLIPLNMRQVQRETGGISNTTTMAWSLPSVTRVNGIYRASRNGVKAFGVSADEALSKLAQLGQQPQFGETIEDEAEDLLKLRQEETQPIVPAQQEPVIDVTPSTPEVPLDSVSPIPQEVQGGESELMPTVPHVDAGVLDEHLEADTLSSTPDQQAEVDEQADELALGPDQVTEEGIY